MSEPRPAHSLHIPGAERLCVTATGFCTAERNELRTVAESLGFRYLPDLVHRSTTHLVCKSVLDAFGRPKYSR